MKTTGQWLHIGIQTDRKDRFAVERKVGLLTLVSSSRESGGRSA